MSITFWAPDAPTRTVIHRPEGYEEYTEEVSVLPEIKLVDSNAFAMLEAFGLAPDQCGSWSASELPEMLRRAVKVANLQSLRELATSETLDTQGAMRVLDRSGGVVSIGRGPRMVSLGRTDDYIRRVALRFVDLFQQAQAGGYQVSWG
ncbi:hypothetical protein KDX27_34800 [Burkholderia cenocepacia]|uniref:hypothetical protein n=1 Tax=Burkholderia cenocepacia TaxID=95486 RepID=UPI001B9181D4|nr:hypothetical protein [Burkholderia cenocepacia]MBR8030062.1 hypothetical protein [Burkholderia cenocepacia]MBR8172899.1 hypothetical protein [Burkholderia cenocepacia]